MDTLQDQIRAYLGEARLAHVEARLVETGRTLEKALDDVVVAVEACDFAPENQLWMGAMTLRRMVGIKPSREDVEDWELRNRIDPEPVAAPAPTKRVKKSKVSKAVTDSL